MTPPRVHAPPPALVATLHDPAGASLAFLEATAPRLRPYAAIVVAATAVTDPLVTSRLIDLGAMVVPGGQTGEGRRAALAAAGPGHAAYVSCDFDRWLHWARCWPEELAALPGRVARLMSSRTPPWYICLGRTPRAFGTHPAAQRFPETATNRALSAAADRPLDAAAGAAWLGPEAVPLILGESTEPTAATDLEWPGIILRHDPARVRGLRCEGLEWETPDFHTEAIAVAGGLAAWTRVVFDTPPMWASRLRLAAASGAALDRVLGEAEGH